MIAEDTRAASEGGVELGSGRTLRMGSKMNERLTLHRCGGSLFRQSEVADVTAISENVVRVGTRRGSGGKETCELRFERLWLGWSDATLQVCKQ